MTFYVSEVLYILIKSKYPMLESNSVLYSLSRCRQVGLYGFLRISSFRHTRVSTDFLYKLVVDHFITIAYA